MKIVRSGSIAAAAVVGGVLGAVTLSACASDASPAGSQGAVATSITGRWVAPDETDETRVTFDENGSFVGFDGCNTHSGSFRTSDGDITFSFTSATEVACSGDVWLENVTSAYLDGDSLVMTDSGGTQLGQLYKTES